MVTTRRLTQPPSGRHHRDPFQRPAIRCFCWLLLAAVVSFASGCASLPTGTVRAPSAGIVASTDTALARIASISAPEPALSGFRLLPSGPFALNTLLELADRSERSLDLQYYLLQNDATGRHLLRALRDAARRGVRVRLLLDDLNTSGQDELLLGLAAHPNVEVRLFNPFPAGRGRVLTRFAASLFDIRRLNRRMHNKLFIADGAMAVTGGRNIADNYFSRHASANFLDLDVFASGAIVPRLSGVFDLYWNSASAYPLRSIVSGSDTPAELETRFDAVTAPSPPFIRDALPEADVLGHGPLVNELNAGKLDLIWGAAEAYGDPPDHPFDENATGTEAHKAMLHVRFNVLEHLRDSTSDALLISPYFIPGRRGMALMREIRGTGVKVSLLTNSLASTDQPLVHTGYLRYRNGLLRLGIDVYELSRAKATRPSRRILFGASVGGLHTKAAVFDRKELFIGSMNFDPRSEMYNTEIGLFIHSPELARDALRLANLTILQASHRLRLTPSGETEWVTPSDADDEVHAEEPESGKWLRRLMDVLTPLVPEQLL